MFVVLVQGVGDTTNELHLFRWLLVPDTPFAYWWEGMTFFLALYIAMWTPLQATFYRSSMAFLDPNPNPVIWTIDRIVDVLLVLDIAISFRTAWMLDNGMIRYNFVEARDKYLKTWFMVDLISALPTDLINSEMTMLRLLRLIKLLKAVKLIKEASIFKWLQRRHNLK